jgi:hypothetical protein
MAIPDLNSLFATGQAGGDAKPDVAHEGMAAADGTFDDQELLELWQKIRKECIDTRLVFERQWHRNILYTLGRQWIEYHSNAGGWKDKRLAQWMPRPVTNKCKETVQAIRSIFTAVHLGVMVRPNGEDPKNVAAAGTADDLAPLIHEIHHMDDVMMEFDFWLLVCGNAFLHTFVDYDMKYGTVSDPSMECADCGTVAKTTEIVDASNACPQCKGTNLTQAQDEEGNDITNERPKGQPVTIPLSPLEVAFSNSYQRFRDLPYIVRLRWRTKAYYEGHPALRDLVPDISWEKGSGDLPLQLFRSLSQHNDLGLAPQYLMGSELSGSDREDGITEYEINYKPCDAYPDGLVFRVVGDKEGGKILHLEDTEAIPGPLPYKDVNGNPLFTFTHAAYEHVGGRVLGSGVIDLIVQKQDQLNQLDSMMLLCLNRMANPVWIIPKGAGIGKLNGMPGLVVEWDSLTLGGQGKPERAAGIDLAAGFFTLREQYLADIEELSGTFDIMKGAKPTGVEAFSALQLLDERSKGRFTPVFQARGNAYADWFKYAIELEREFGPDARTLSVQSSARGWTFQNFKRADLQGDVCVVVESGSTTPKTSLGMRAALDHAVTMKFINPQDPDQCYEGLKLMGLQKMIPAMDIDVQSALQKQDAFEKFAADKGAQQQAFAQTQQALGEWEKQVAQQTEQRLNSIRTLPATAPLPPQQPPPPPPSPLQFTPLVWRPWYNPVIHHREFLKWANSDNIRALLGAQPQMAQMLTIHLQEITAAMPPAQAEPAKIQFSFQGADVAGDADVRKLFEREVGLPPTPPSAPEPSRTTPQKEGDGKGPAPGLGSAMKDSNRESTKGVESLPKAT